jgi:pSer/pThr/pTyr-binding forkhead associated (FHA) protein
MIPAAADELSGRTGQYVTSPLTQPSGRLVVLGKDGSDGAVYPLHGDTIDVGAREGMVQIPDDPYMSPRHARLQREEGGKWLVIDLDSTNGIFVKLRGVRPLADGDLILLGQQVLRFEVVTDAEQGLRPAMQHGTALFGTPQAPRFARLSQRTVEGVTRDIFHVHRAETSLGREAADIVFSDDPFLSRRHAVIRAQQPVQAGSARTFTIEDHGSSNGTFVALRGREPLQSGDVIRMGLHVFRFDLTAENERGVRQ